MWVKGKVVIVIYLIWDILDGEMKRKRFLKFINIFKGLEENKIIINE